MIKRTIYYTNTTTLPMPANCLSMYIVCIGSGAPGAGVNSSTGARAGASGAQCSIYTLDTTALAGTTIYITVGVVKPGTSGNNGNGNDSHVAIGFIEMCRAKGGIGAVTNTPGAGSVTGGVGDTIYKGGDGAAGSDTQYGGGGGASGSLHSDGNDASTYQQGYVIELPAGEGGEGYNFGTDGDGLAPIDWYGGGGGGALRTNSGTSLGGDGAPGLIIITYTLDKGSMFVIFD